MPSMQRILSVLGSSVAWWAFPLICLCGPRKVRDIVSVYDCRGWWSSCYCYYCCCCCLVYFEKGKKGQEKKNQNYHFQRKLTVATSRVINSLCHSPRFAAVNKPFVLIIQSPIVLIGFSLNHIESIAENYQRSCLNFSPLFVCLVLSLFTFYVVPISPPVISIVLWTPVFQCDCLYWKCTKSILLFCSRSIFVLLACHLCARSTGICIQHRKCRKPKDVAFN